jgi:hypothetical protein
MRSATLISILILAGCASGTAGPSTNIAAPGSGSGSAGSAPDGGPATSADGGSADAGTIDGGSADAGTADAGLAAHCDPALDPAAGVTLTGVSSAPSCAGLVPTLPSCVSEIAACSGWHSGPGGPSGNVTTRGTSDGAGAIALHCANVDLGPSPGFTMYLDGAAGYTKGVHLGDQAWGLPSGMIAVTTSYAQRPPPYDDFVSHDGALLGNVAQGSSRLYVSAATIEIVTPEPVAGGVQLFAQQVDRDGSPLGARVAVSDFIATTNGVLLGGAADDRGGTLVAWGVYGQSTSSGRWLDATGQAATAVFAIPVAPLQLGGAAGLTAGNGVAFADSSGHWSLVAASGATALSPAPGWLAAMTGSVTLVHGGRALAFVANFAKDLQIVAPDGTSCGTLTLPGNASIGTDGTVFATSSDKNFLVYPQLLH